MSIQKEIINTEIRTSGFKKVQEDIIKTMKTLDQYQDELKDLKHRREELIAAEKKGTEEYRNVTKRITELKANIKLQTDELKKQESQLTLTQMSYKQLSQRASELRKKLQEMSEAVDPAAYTKARTELKLYESQMAKMRQGMSQIDKSFGDNSVWSRVKQMAGATAIIAGISSGLRKIFGDMINVRQEFEKYEALLTNTLGSEVLMRSSMAMLTEFAAKTPYALTEVVGGFVKLVNQGFKPTEAEMVKLGDLASSQGKSFDQLVEAIIDAQTGEFERLKEFGIRASKEGDKVTFTFKGVQQQVDFTSKSIRDYILSLGDAEGVAGGMAQVSETLGGKISNIGDAWDRWMNTLGSSSGGILSWIADKIINIVEALDYASMSIDQIKLKVRDDAAKQNLENALKGIDAMTESGLKQGMTKQEAAKRAVRLYTESMTTTLNGYKKALETATGAEAESLQSKIDLMEDELELVKDHFKQQEQRSVTPQKQTITQNSTWSLTSDESYLRAKAELREKQLNGEIATEEEYNKLVLALEIETLEKRIAVQQEKGAALAKLEEQLLEKRYQQQRAARTREQQLLDIAAQGDSDSDQENAAYEKQLKALDLFGRQIEEMTETEQAAYLQLKRAHYEKLSSLYVDELANEIDNQQKSIQRKATALKQAHAEELATATTFEQKKALIAQWASDSELRRIETDKQADQALQRHYAEEEQTALKEDLNRLLETYQSIVNEIGDTGLLANGIAATEDDVARLQAIIDNLKKQVAELGVTPQQTFGGEDRDTKRKDVDIFGMTRDQWAEMFDNLEESKDKAAAIGEAISAFGGAFSEAFGTVSNLMTAMEERDLKNFEKSQNKKKKLLERQLKSGTISQERYNEAVQLLDEQTDAKREEMERKQAKREKLQAVFNSLINTAVAVTAALPNIPLSIIVAAMGAAETAAILATPLPGAEEGGMIGVDREQDGKHFYAEFTPRKRGFIRRPTVIRTTNGQPILTAEAGTEYVVPNDLLRHPEVAEMVSLIEAARLSGSFRSPRSISTSVPGFETGGYVGENYLSPSVNGASRTDTASLPDNSLIRELRDAVGKLSKKLDEPIPVYNSIYGRDGIETIKKKLIAQQRRAGIGGK